MSDEQLKRYIRKRGRRWAHRHMRDDGDHEAATVAAQDTAPETDAGDGGQSSRPSPQPAAQPRLQSTTLPAQAQGKRTAGDEPRRSQRKRDRRWEHGYVRNDGDREPATVEIREPPLSGDRVYARPLFGPPADDAD